MANAIDRVGKVKRVTIDGFFVDIPAGLGAEEEAKLMAELTERIAKDEELHARRKLAAERQERFDTRLDAVREQREREEFKRLSAKFAAPDGVD